MSNYFSKFEERQPPKPLKHSLTVEMLWQFFATLSICLGAWYIYWRWSSSLNFEALWFSIPLALAETCAYIGLIIFVINIWQVKDFKKQAPPMKISECVSNTLDSNKLISVDIFFPTYSEDTELVRLSIIDAKKIKYPHPIDIMIYVLDDGKRPEMEEVAKQEGVGYITRDNNIGFKAGNMRNAMENTYGDFILICDADTRPFPTILENTLGYFRDPDVAWVQTPQWFFDIPDGRSLDEILKKRFSSFGEYLGKGIQRIFGKIEIGKDPFSNDPRLFYDVIQRRRNWANASFCCGAGSIHRREAVMEVAMKTFADSIDGYIRKFTDEIEDESLRDNLKDAMAREMALETELTPYKFHVSEDIYTSIILHSDPERNWKSVFHPEVESKMLSPQDLLSWTVQRFKYAGGTLDIFFNDNPLFKKGLKFPQKLMYGATFFSYFACLWNIVFLIAPIVYLFLWVAPVSTTSFEFFKHFLPFFLSMQFAFMLGTWGISAWRGSTFYLSFFAINFRALFVVLQGKKIKFPITPKDRQEGNFLNLVIPQMLLIALTISGIAYTGIQGALGNFTNFGGYFANIFWGLLNVFSLLGIVKAALWKPE